MICWKYFSNQRSNCLTDHGLTSCNLHNSPDSPGQKFHKITLIHFKFERKLCYVGPVGRLDISLPAHYYTITWSRSEPASDREHWWWWYDIWPATGNKVTHLKISFIVITASRASGCKHQAHIFLSSLLRANFAVDLILLIRWKLGHFLDGFLDANGNSSQSRSSPVS